MSKVDCALRARISQRRLRGEVRPRADILLVHETQRLKYFCGHCHGAVVRAQLPVLPPIPKSMASASLLAYLIVSKFADGLPLYRIAGRLARLGIELSHTLMSEWLVDCAELLEGLHRRMVLKVLDSGHVYTDDTTLPLQNHDPTRRRTYEAKLWVYAKDDRHGPPLNSPSPAPGMRP